MSRNNLVASFGLVAAVTAALSAQTASNMKDQKTIQSISVKVIGCVASAREAGHYSLINASLSGDPVPSTAWTTGTRGSGRDVSFENSPSFDLIGDRLKAHLGHEVEVVGITSDTKLNNSDSESSAIGSSTHQKATLTVTSIKMVAATCR